MRTKMYLSFEENHQKGSKKHGKKNPKEGGHYFDGKKI